jgi:hypothetical protein
MERFKPVFWRFRFPLLDLRVIALMLSFSVTTMVKLSRFVAAPAGLQNRA